MESNATDTTTTEPTAQPVEVLTADKVNEIVKSAISEVVKQQPEQAGISKEDIQKALEDQRKAIAKAVSGEPDEPKENPLLRKFVDNPEEVLAKVIEVAKDSAKKEIGEQVEQEKAFQHAWYQTLADRPDVTSSKNASDVFLQFYKATSNNKNEVERFKEALGRYDLFLEENNAGDAKARIEKARGLAVSTSMAASTEPKRKSEADMLAEEQAERKANYLRTRGKLN
jgi:hypothetical protein